MLLTNHEPTLRFERCSRTSDHRAAAVVWRQSKALCAIPPDQQVPGPGYGRVDEFAPKHGVGLYRQQENYDRIFRSLRLVDRRRLRTSNPIEHAVQQELKRRRAWSGSSQRPSSPAPRLRLSSSRRKHGLPTARLTSNGMAKCLISARANSRPEVAHSLLRSFSWAGATEGTLLIGARQQKYEQKSS